MSENRINVAQISGTQNSAGMSGELGAGALIVNDYRITTEPIDGGHRLTVTRGSEVQTIDVKDGVGIANIVKTGSTGDVDSYRINFTDGSTFDYAVETNAAAHAAAEDARADAEAARAETFAGYENRIAEAESTAQSVRDDADAGKFNGKDAPQESVLYTAQSLTDEQRSQARENIAAAGVARVEAVETALAGKLDEPAEGLAVGKYFRVAALDANGHAVLGAVDAAQVGVQDVRIAGATIVADGVAKVPDATNNAKGVVRGNTSIFDSNFAVSAGSPYCMVRSASDFYSQGISCFVSSGTLLNVLRYPSLMPTLSADEQAAARERMGIPGDFVLFDEISSKSLLRRLSIKMCLRI